MERTLKADSRKLQDKRERVKLATYLGARTRHRFETKPLAPRNAGSWRMRLLLIAILFLLISVWGLWMELSGR